MIDWRKYPFVRIFLPFLFGIVAGAFLAIQKGMGGHVAGIIFGVGKFDKLNTPLLVTLIVLVCILLLSRGRAGKQYIWSLLFRFSAYLLFFLFGILLSFRSHSAVFAQYGDRYSYYIYNNNIMQSEKAMELRDLMQMKFHASRPDKDEEKALAEAMSIGYRHGISKEVRQQFSASGLSHLLALSGFHISIIYILFSSLFVWARGSVAGRNLTGILVLMFLWGYAFFTGMSPSIVRAVIFCTITELCIIMQGDVRLINSCALAAFIILLIEPLMIGHIGFQLSFTSVIGISLLYKRIPRNSLLSILSITLICTVFTFPLIAYHFGSVPVYGLLSNILAAIPAYSIVFCSALWWILTLIGLPAMWLLHIIIYMASILMSIARIVSSLPYATIAYSPTVPETLLWYMVILSAVTLCHKITARRIILFLSGIEILLVYFILHALFF